MEYCRSSACRERLLASPLRPLPPVIPSKNDELRRRLRFRVELWGPAASKDSHSRVTVTADGHGTPSTRFLRSHYAGSPFQRLRGSLLPQRKPHTPPHSHILNPSTRSPAAQMAGIPVYHRSLCPWTRAFTSPSITLLFRKMGG